MTSNESKLEERLNALPDVYPGFTKSSMFTIKTRGLVDEVLQMLIDNPDAITETVIEFEWVYCGLVDRYDDDGNRLPVDSKRLALTSGMHSILADMKGKTLKSYQLASASNDGVHAECNVRLNLGQHAVDLNCYDFAFDIGGQIVELGAMHCEKMSLRDDFGINPDIPVRAYAVNERITGVELVTDHVEVGMGDETQELNVDVAVALRTAHAVYTFARESWASTRFVIAKSDDIAAPYAEGECDCSWLCGSARGGVDVKAIRSTIRLA